MKHFTQEGLELWLERKEITPFLSSCFQLLEDVRMRSLIGAGYTKEVCVMKGGIAYWLRSIEDLSNLPKLHHDFIIQTDVAKLKSLLEKANSVYEQADATIDAIENAAEEAFAGDLRDFLSGLHDILIYTTSIPYYLLTALESGEVESSRRNLVYETCEKLRRDSKYVRAQKVFLSKLERFLMARPNFSQGEAPNMLCDELLSLLDDPDWHKDEKMADRSTSCVFWLDTETQRHMVSYDSLLVEQLLTKYVHIEPTSEIETQVKGTIAYKGFVKGKVAIVRRYDHLSKVEEGDIIVSPSTNPSLMPALVRCGAIVADEGGVGSHAAIVARELKKPCIFGTKNGTRIFKDGDLVEVDANSGIVRILARS